MNPLRAAEPETAPATDHLSRQRALEQDLEKLNQLPIARELLLLSRHAMEFEERTAREGVLRWTRVADLEQTNAGAAYRAKWDEISRQQQQESVAAVQQLADAAERMYKARHDELAAARPADIPHAHQLGFTILTYPRVDGSPPPTSVIIASRFFQVPYEWEYPKPNGNIFSHYWLGHRQEEP